MTLQVQEFTHGVRITIQIKTRSQKTELIVGLDGTMILHVKAPPIEGKANREIVKWLAKRFRKSSSQIRLVVGARSRTKIIEILNITRTEASNVLGMNLEQQTSCSASRKDSLNRSNENSR